MMAIAPAAPKGPRLTLVVNSAHLARLDPSKPALLSPKKTHPYSPLHSPKRAYPQSPKSLVSPILGATRFDRPTEERQDRVFHILNSQGQAQALPPNGAHAVSPLPTTPHRRAPSVGQRLMTDKIQKYLDGIAAANATDPDDEPPQGSRNPHPQLVAPERNEHYLMKALKMNQDAQRNQYEENRLALEAKIRELEKTVAEKDDRIAQLAAQIPKTPQTTARPNLSDAEVAAWYENRSGSWSAWVDEFAHEDSNRIAGLHPLQHRELRNGVRNFVRLTDDGNLPASIFTPGKASPFNTTRLLLYGLLNDFIVREILESPFWVFSAISRQAFDVDSPMIAAPSYRPYQTPAALRLDTTTGWSSSGLPPLISPFNVPPAPTTARSLEMLSPRHGPALLQPQAALSLATRGLSLQYNLPSKPDIEDLETLLVRTQPKDGEANIWRAQMMKILSDGGLSRDLCHASLANNEDKQMLANARREYARQLKDKFLSSAARFFLRDQDPQGIAILESRLVSELDFALRFSAQAWARPTPLSFIGLKQLNAAPLRGPGVGDDVVDFFPASSQQARARGEKQQVVVVLRPAIGTMRKIGGPGKVWVKAQSIASPVSMSPSLIDIDNDESYSETSIGTPSLSSLSTPSFGTSSQQTSTTPKSADSNVMLPNRGLSLRGWY